MSSDEKGKSPAPKGKIARLPALIREAVNVRLLDGQPGPKIIGWLHTLPEVLSVLDEHFNEQPISAQNLSEWRTGAYQVWIEKRDKLDNMKLLSNYALKMAEAAGGSVSEGAAAIAGGKILELLETADEEDLIGLSLALAKLRDSDAKMITAKVNKTKLTQKDREIALAEARFQQLTVEQFIKWARTPEAQAILNSGDSKPVQMKELIQLMFGEKPA